MKEGLPKINSERWLSLGNLEGESWKDIKNYEGFYQVSNYGRIKSLQRNVPTKGGSTRISNVRILKAKINQHGYCTVTLIATGMGRGFFMVHRLVAEAFIPNTNHLPFINHKDENKLNNVVLNLEWCTAKYNTNYGTGIERRSKSQMCTHPNSKRVRQLNLNGEEVAVFDSLAAASRAMGVHKTRIARCCRGEKNANTSCGYKWEFV